MGGYRTHSDGVPVFVVAPPTGVGGEDEGGGEGGRGGGEGDRGGGERGGGGVAPVANTVLVVHFFTRPNRLELDLRPRGRGEGEGGFSRPLPDCHPAAPAAV